MTNIFKTTFAAVTLTLSISSNALAGEDTHEAVLNWSDNMTIAQNYAAAVKSVNKYCRIEASRTNERSRSFKQKFKTNCVTQLMENYVEQIDNQSLSTYHAMTKDPITKTTQFAAK